MCSTIFFLSPAPILPHPHNLNFTRLRIPSQPTPNQYHRHTISTSLNSVFPPIPHPPKIIFTLSQLHCSSYSLLSLTHPKSSSHYLNFTALHIPSYPPPTQDNLHSISTSLLFIFPPIPHPPKIIFTLSQLHCSSYSLLSPTHQKSSSHNLNFTALCISLFHFAAVCTLPPCLLHHILPNHRTPYSLLTLPTSASHLLNFDFSFFPRTSTILQVFQFVLIFSLYFQVIYQCKVLHVI